jgi:hypothetical protein
LHTVSAVAALLSGAVVLLHRISLATVSPASWWRFAGATAAGLGAIIA